MRRGWPVAKVLLAALLIVFASAAVSYAQEPLIVVFASPSDGATVFGTVAIQFESGGGADPDGNQIVVRHFVLQIDGTTVADFTSNFPYSHQEAGFSWQTAGYANGPHLFGVTVTDELGQTASAAMTVNVQNGPQPVVWTIPVKVAVDGNSITKSAGCDGCADSGAISQQTITSGAGFVEFKVSANAYLTVGLSNGNPGTSSNEVKFGLRFFPGDVQVRESGVYKAGWSQIAGAVYKVAVEGGAVKYYENGALKYTSALSPTYPLLVDTALLTLNAGVQSAVISAGSGGGTPPPAPDTTPPTVAITAPAGGSTLSGTATVTATASDAVGVSSVQLQVDGVNVGPADTTAPYSFAWNTSTATNGPHTLTAVAKDAAGNTTVSAPVSVTTTNTMPGPGPQPVVWTSAVKVAVSGTTITKNAGCEGCGDAGAISQQLISSGTGFVQFSVSSNTSLTAGLSNGNPGTTGSEIDFGLRFYPGSPGIVEVRESGAYKWDFQHVAGAVYKVAVEAGVVKYYQNGALKYTSALAPSLPLLLDASINTVAGAVQNAVISTAP